MEENTNDREETLVELGSRFLKKLGQMVKDIEETQDLHEDIDDAYIEKLKHYVHEWDQIDFQDLTNAVSSCLDFENDIDEVKSDLGSLSAEFEDLKSDTGDLKNDVENLQQDDEDLKSEVAANTAAVEDYRSEITTLDRRLANIERIFNALKLALSNDISGD